MPRYIALSVDSHNRRRRDQMQRQQDFVEQGRPCCRMLIQA